MKMGTSKNQNLTDEEKDGLVKMKKRVDLGEVVVFTTDKSNRLSMSSPEDYVESMKSHIEKERKTDDKGSNKISRTLNRHFKDFVKILQIGKTYGQTKRAIVNATVNENGEIPVSTGTHKDHKDPTEGFKMRPIVNAMNGPKCALSGMIRDVLEGVIENIGSTSVCKSTEELLYTFEEYNKKIDILPSHMRSSRTSTNSIS